ncbi:chemotaxis protein CheC [Planctomycetota bacterium]
MDNKLQHINQQAATNATEALSKLIDRPVVVGISKAEVKKVEDLSPFIGPEDVVAGIYLPVTGDIRGAALLIFPQDTSFILCDLLVKRELGTTRKLTKLDESALKEVGNIISGNYLSVLANTLQVKIVEHIPNFSFDMFGAIVSQIITEFAQKTENALVIEIEFIFEPETFKGYFLLLFEVEQFMAMIGSFGGGGKDLFVNYLESIESIENG